MSKITILMSLLAAAVIASIATISFMPAADEVELQDIGIERNAGR